MVSVSQHVGSTTVTGSIYHNTRTRNEIAVITRTSAVEETCTTLCVVLKCFCTNRWDYLQSSLTVVSDGANQSPAYTTFRYRHEKKPWSIFKSGRISYGQSVSTEECRKLHQRSLGTTLRAPSPRHFIQSRNILLRDFMIGLRQNDIIFYR